MTNIMRQSLSAIFAVFAILILTAALAPSVPQKSECACATELADLQEQFEALKEKQFNLEYQHYRICRAKHGVQDHDIRSRRQQ